MDLAVGVAETGVGERLADRPGDGADATVLGGRLGRPVEVGGLVEVAREQQRPAVAQQALGRREQGLDRRQANVLLGREHVGDGHAAGEPVRPVLHVVEVRVDHRDGLARPDLDPGVETVRAGRLEDRVLRQDLQSDVVVRVVGRGGDLGEPVVGLEHADHVGIEVGQHRVGGGGAAVLHVEDEQVERHRRGRGGGGRRLLRRVGVGPARAAPEECAAGQRQTREESSRASHGWPIA